MEHSPHVSQEKTVKPRESWPSNKILRPGMVHKFKALAAAGVVGLAGATMSDNAEAQYSYSQSTYNGNTSNHVVVSGGRAVGAMMGSMVVNQGLRAMNAPVQVVGMDAHGRPIVDINMNQMPSMRVETDPQAVEVLNRLGLAYGTHPFYIVNPRDPNGVGQKLNMGPSTVAVRVSKAGESNVFVDVVYMRNNQRFIQKFAIGATSEGRMIASIIADQVDR